MSRRSLRQFWRSSWLFFPFTSSSASPHDKEADAQQQQSSPSAHNPQRATRARSGTASSGGEASHSVPARSPLRPPLPLEQLDTNATIALALAFLLGSATAVGAFTVYRRYFKRIRNAQWITPDLLGRKRWITGIVTRCVLLYCSNSPIDHPPTPGHCSLPPTPNSSVRTRVFIYLFLFGSHSVGDADNFRLYHTPGFGWRGLLKFRHVPTKRGARQPFELTFKN